MFSSTGDRASAPCQTGIGLSDIPTGYTYVQFLFVFSSDALAHHHKSFIDARQRHSSVPQTQNLGSCSTHPSAAPLPAQKGVLYHMNPPAVNVPGSPVSLHLRRQQIDKV